MSGKNKLRVAGIAALVVFCLMITIVIGFLAVYVFMSYLQKDKPPADFAIQIPETISAGSNFDLRVSHLYRYKLCPYRRFINIEDSAGKTQNLQEVPGYPPPLLGANPDIVIGLKLDPKLAPGNAIFKILLEYTCPSNFFHAVLNDPYIARREVPFTITPKTNKED